MSARILVVDDVLTNAKLLEARLTAEYFDVLIAKNGVEALDVIKRSDPDIVLLDVMMPGMDGFEVCRRVKENPKTQHIPIIMVTALNHVDDRVKGLEAGADDFLTKPVNDIALLARVKSLVRLKAVTNELRMRSLTSADMGLGRDPLASMPAIPVSGNILLIEDDTDASDAIMNTCGSHHNVRVETNAVEAMMVSAEEDIDLLIVSLSLRDYDGLRFCSQIRSVERTRHIPILVIVEQGDNGRLVRALDLGVNDYILRPIDENELIARARTQLRRKSYADQLRKELQNNFELAVTDDLTGLHNRRYMESHLSTLFDEAVNRGKDLSVLTMDIDFFKAVNDNHGHDVGDRVLKEFAQRVIKITRDSDLLCRYGGEEFVLVMPETSKELAVRIAERMRKSIAETPFSFGMGKEQLDITISIGVGTIESPSDKPEDVIRRSDLALYEAKNSGRNRVVAYDDNPPKSVSGLTG